MIHDDIEEFEQRIQVARDKLAVLPTTAGTWQARKKIKEKGRVLEAEVEHVKKLISIAQETLTD